MKVGVIQFDCKLNQKRNNLTKVKQLLGDNQADLWVLPELFNTGYLFSTKEELIELAEPIPDGQTTKFLIELCKNNNTSIIAGIAENFNSQIFNSAIFVTQKGVLNTYRKIHLFNREKLFFTPGNTKYEVIDFNGAKIGIMICFDWIFPEAARTLALKGADIIAHPANLVLPYCQKAMVTRCIENRIFAITTNRIGTENSENITLTFTGHSQIVSPNGDVIAKASQDQEEVLIQEIQHLESRKKNITELNEIFKDRRTKFYNL